MVDVSKGYLRNYLIPRKLAEPATRGAVAAAERRAVVAERAVANAAAKAEESAALLNKTVLTIPHQAGEDGRLFGSVTTEDIADAIKRGARHHDRPPQHPPRGADPLGRHPDDRRRDRGRRHGDRQDDGGRAEVAHAAGDRG